MPLARQIRSHDLADFGIRRERSQYVIPGKSHECLREWIESYGTAKFRTALESVNWSSWIPVKVLGLELMLDHLHLHLMNRTQLALHWVPVCSQHISLGLLNLREVWRADQ